MPQLRAKRNCEICRRPTRLPLDWKHTVVQKKSGITGFIVLPRIPMACINHGEIFIENRYWH